MRRQDERKKEIAKYTAREGSSKPRNLQKKKEKQQQFEEKIEVRKIARLQEDDRTKKKMARERLKKKLTIATARGLTRKQNLRGKNWKKKQKLEK